MEQLPPAILEAVQEAREERKAKEREWKEVEEGMKEEESEDKLLKDMDALKGGQSDTATKDKSTPV